jgi:hypothetical protein
MDLSDCDLLQLKSGLGILGRLRVIGFDFPTWICDFQAADLYSSYGHLFKQLNRLLALPNTHDLEENPELERLHRQIDDLALCITSDTSGLLCAVTDVYIEGNRARFRLRPDRDGRYVSDLRGD